MFLQMASNLLYLIVAIHLSIIPTIESAMNLEYLLSLRSGDLMELNVGLDREINYSFQDNDKTTQIYQINEGTVYIGAAEAIDNFRDSYLEKFIGTKVLIFKDIKGEHSKDVEAILDELMFSDEYYCQQRKTTSSGSSYYYFINHLEDIRVQVFTSRDLNIITID